MSGGDRTGPTGMGPMSGRGGGYCGGRGLPGGTKRGFRGGCGRGNHRLFHATGLTGSQRATVDTPKASPAADAQRHIPQEEVDLLRSQLDEMTKRLAELETAKTQE